MLAVTNTSPLLYLVLIDQVDLLPTLYDQVMVPRAVAGELQHPSAPANARAWVHALPSWCALRAPRHPVPSELLRLGAGEREAIVLAEEWEAGRVLLDDSAGRHAARRRAYTSYKVANLPIEFSRSIPRAQRRPGYGDGFRGAPLEDRGIE